jgi:hypothetical protein
MSANILATGLAEMPAAGQAPTSQPASSSLAKTSILKTPWGRPDLQGTWSDMVVVPFERPKEFGERQFLTDAEHRKAIDELIERNKLPGPRDSREGRGTEKDVARAFADYWFGDKPTEVSRRTSMIIDPPDGRMPAYTPETLTAEDPTTWVKPFTFVEELRKNADKPHMVYEGGCQEGDYALLDMLANTRAAERLFAEGKGPDPAREDNATGGGGAQ